MTFKPQSVVLLTLSLTCVGLPASAVIYSPTQSELLNIVDVTDNFGGGGSLFEAFEDGSGVIYDFDFAPGGDGISRVVLENDTFTTDLSSFDSFDILFTPQSFNLNVKSYLITGEDGFFESTTQQIGLNSESRIALPLDQVENTDDVRGYGLQIFDPENGSSFGTLGRVETAPEPPITVETQLFSFEGSTPDAYQNWGGSFGSDATHAIGTNQASDGSQSLRITRTDPLEAGTFQFGTEFYLNADADQGLADGIVAPDPDTGRPAVNATSQEVDDFIQIFEGDATKIALDLIVDPEELDPSVSFLGVNLFLNDGTGDFWHNSNGEFFFDPTVAATHEVVFDFEGLPGIGTGGDGSGFDGFDVDTETVRIGISTNFDAPGSVFIDNIRLITELDAAVGLAGDYNENGSVEQGDLNLVLNNWGTMRTFEDGVSAFTTANVDQEELNLVLNNWGDTTAPSFSGSTVPEPGTALMILTGATGLLARRSHR
ncbi:MAG: PEP-CTERM sorting domain-containing protein [Planctomycetota bacterium]